MSRGWVRRALNQFFPAGVHDPVGLAQRLDLLLSLPERRRYRQSPGPERPVILVCGAARSGTSLAAQLLIRNLPVAFLDNLMAVFPRSPILARRLLGGRLPAAPIAYHSYYGRTSGWRAPSDALNLWDRWLGSDRAHPPQRLEARARSEMSAFFGALDRETGLPVVAKNNALNASAHLVAEALPTARFICLQRSREALAASLYRARLEIHGTATVPYGLVTGDPHRERDALEDVCRQVLYHERLAREQQERIGAERFTIVRYEDICRAPRDFVTSVGRSFLDVTPDFAATDPSLGPFATGQRAADGELLAALRETFIRLGAAA